MPSKKPLALGYIRVSSYVGRAREEALTEDIQLTKIRQWCDLKDLELIDVITDTDVSGKHFERGRKGFTELMRRIDRREADVIVVYRMSRFGRNFLETVAAILDLRKRGIQFHSASETLDLESAQGRLFMNILASFDEYERELRSEYWAETKQKVMTERGVHLGRTPLGYLRHDGSAAKGEDPGEARRKKGTLLPDPRVAPWVAEAFKRRAAGETLGAIVDMLNDEAPMADGGLWTHTQLQRMLSLRVYLGEIRQGDLVVPGAHEAIVDENTFARVQALPKAPRRQAASVFPLRGGKLRCAGCSYPMTGWNQKRIRGDGSEYRVRVYRCVRTTRRGVCENRAVVTADDIEAYVRSQLEPWARRYIAEAEPDTLSDDRVAELRAQLDALGVRMQTVATEMSDLMDPDTWRQSMSALAAQRADVQAHLEEELSRVAGSGASVSVSWDELDEAEQWDAMLRLIDCAAVVKGRRPAAEKTYLFPLGTVAPRLPGPHNDWHMVAIDLDAAQPDATAESA